MRLSIYPIFLITLLTSNLLLSQSNDFELLASSKTGIDFKNTIKANLETSENLFDFDYFYNGAGVAVVDINNDGLQDVYFASNQGQDKLYKNLGNFRFEDITEQAFNGFTTQWSTGVSIVDLNQDGWLDIYVCQGGPRNSELRKNLLFINQGDESFVESANIFGLDDTGMSTQALFLDFDKDGDQDCFVLNESLAYGLDPLKFTRLNLEQKPRLYESYSHFYRNDAGLFVDVTKELGMDQATFGLGIGSFDANQDGWEDIYISNDYYVPDMLYINNKGKGFVDQIKLRTKQMSFYGMGMDIADMNNDGHSDIFVLDMASGDHYRSKTLMRSMDVDNFRLLVEGLQLPYQYMFNSLQLNSGNGTYNNIAQLSGVSSTDWSWSVLMEDFDFDGLKDIHITNGYRRYALDNDFQKKVFEAKAEHNGEVPIEIKRELYDQMPTEKLRNIFYKNTSDLRFESWMDSSEDNPPSYSNGAAVADFDNDGDVDLVINNMDAEAFVYKNLARENARHNFLALKQKGNTSNAMQRVELFSGEERFAFEPRRVRGYMSSSEPSIFLGLGKEQYVDSLKILLADGSMIVKEEITANRILYLEDFEEARDLGLDNLKNKKAKPFFRELVASNLGLSFTHLENPYDDFKKEILLPFKQSTLGPLLTSADVNKDGKDDLIISNSVGTPARIFIQNESGFEAQEFPLELNTAIKETGEISVLDLNKDGRQDFIIPGGGNEKPQDDLMYESGLIISNTDTSFTYQALFGDMGSTKKIIPIDFDQDGDEDLFVINRHVPQKYPMHAASKIYENQDGRFIDVSKTVFPQLAEFGIINDAELADLNKDGIQDLVVVGEWTGIGFFENRSASFVQVNADYGIPEMYGLWFSIASEDLNKDGQPDFIIGNLGENSKYHATETKPLKVYGGDFDNNGTWDLVLSKLYKNEFVPLRGLECSSDQMPFIKDKFKTYDMFAKSSLTDVYGNSLEDAYHRYANTMSSYALLSNAQGKYTAVALPALAQSFPILDIEMIDIDANGKVEMILSGNIYNTEVETPRLDAGMGLILSYDNETGFRAHPRAETGLNLEGNIKSTTLLYHTGMAKHILVASQNNGALKVFSVLDVN